MARVSQYHLDTTPPSSGILYYSDLGDTPSSRATKFEYLVVAIPSFVGDSGSGGSKGLVPAPSSGDANKYLKGDGTWASVSGVGGGTPGGSDTQLQFNDSSSFGGSTSLTFNKTTKKLSLFANDSQTVNLIELNTPSSGNLLHISPSGWLGVNISPHAPLTIKTNYYNTNSTLRIGDKSIWGDGSASIAFHDGSNTLQSWWLGHTASNTTTIGFQTSYLHINENVKFNNNSHTEFNYNNANYDFIVRSQYNNNIFFVDASADTVSIGKNTAVSKLDVLGDISLSSSGVASELRFYEPSGDGTNYTSFKSQTQSANITYTLPATVGSNGQVLATDDNGVLSWSAIPTGSGAPGGTNGQLQFNSNGVFGGASGTYWDGDKLALGDTPNLAKLAVKSYTNHTLNSYFYNLDTSGNCQVVLASTFPTNFLRLMTNGASTTNNNYPSSVGASTDGGKVIINSQGSAVNEFLIGTANSDPLAFYTNNSVRMKINGTGLIGINNIYPSGQLHQVVSSGVVGHIIDITNSHGANAFEVNGNQSGGSKFLINDKGWVGINVGSGLDYPFRIDGDTFGSLRYDSRSGNGANSIYFYNSSNNLQTWIHGNTAGADSQIGTFTSKLDIYANLITLSGPTTINEAGSDFDFRVEGDNQTHCLFVDGGEDTAKVSVGLSTGLAKLGGRYYSTTIPSGNIGTGEDDLTSITSLPANSFDKVGSAIKLYAWGSTANNINSKVVKCYIGSSGVITANLESNTLGFWIIEANFIKHSTDVQKYIAEVKQVGSNPEIKCGTVHIDDASAITFKVTGEATDDDDIICEGVYLDFMN